MANEAPQRRHDGTAGADAATIDIRHPRAATTTAATTTAATTAAATTTAAAAAAAISPDAGTAPIAVDHTLTSPHPDPRGVAFGPGDRIHRYQLTSLLGMGGMGVVYAADDLELHRPVAIKLLHHGGGVAAAERALREARAMAQFRHANVVPLFDVGVHHGHVYLVMPLLEEGTLGGWLRATRRPWRAIVRKFALAARGLEAAHAAGLVHRDFKPDNVLLGADDEVRVADFGLVSAEAEPAPAAAPIEGGFAATQTRLRGTPAYMAPEQLDGADVDGRADQFAFCVALHAAVYGQRPFAEADADPLDLGALRDAIRAGRMRPAPRGRRVPRWLAAVLARGLHDDPADRWPSMAALVAALDRGLARSRWGLAGLAVGLAALAGIAVAVVHGAGTRRTEPLPGLGHDMPATNLAARTLEAERHTSIARVPQLVDVALSPDGSQIAVVNRRELLLIPTAGGDPRILHREDDNADLTNVTWSPDSKRVLLHRLVPRHGSLYHLIDVASKAAVPIEHVSGPWGTLLPGDEIVSAWQPDKRLLFAAADPRGERRACKLAGTYQWINGLYAIDSTIYVRVAYPDGEQAWLATDRNCATPRRVCRGTAIPVSGERCIVLTGDRDERHVVVQGRYGQPIGRPRRVPRETVMPIGVLADGSAVLVRASPTWRLVELSTTDVREIAGEVGSAPHLALAPDLKHVAITESTGDDASETRIVKLDRLHDRSTSAMLGLRAATWSPDGTRLAAFDGSHIVLIDVASLTRRTLNVADISPSTDLAWLDDRRVAYLPTDHTTYRWLDIIDAKTGDVLDATQGWAAQMTRAGADGSLAVFWNNRRRGRGVWLIAPGGEPRLARNTDTLTFAWSPNDPALWLLHDKTIELYDPRSQTRRPFRTLDSSPTTHIVDLLPIASDRVLVETQDTFIEFVRIDP